MDGTVSRAWFTIYPLTCRAATYSHVLRRSVGAWNIPCKHVLYYWYSPGPDWLHKRILGLNMRLTYLCVFWDGGCNGLYCAVVGVHKRESPKCVAQANKYKQLATFSVRRKNAYSQISLKVYNQLIKHVLKTQNPYLSVNPSVGCEKRYHHFSGVVKTLIKMKASYWDKTSTKGYINDYIEPIWD